VGGVGDDEVVEERKPEQLPSLAEGAEINPRDYREPGVLRSTRSIGEAVWWSFVPPRGGWYPSVPRRMRLRSGPRHAVTARRAVDTVLGPPVREDRDYPVMETAMVIPSFVSAFTGSSLPSTR
jgi:hypothetical protein